MLSTANGIRRNGRQDNDSSNDCLGIYFGREVLEGCRASRRWLGAVRYQQATVPIDGRPIQEVLTELLESLGSSKNCLPVCVAIASDVCYFATRPTASGSRNASPRALLRESLRSHTVRLDQMAIDVLHWQPDRRLVASIVAAPTERVEEIRSVIAESGHALQRIEPAASCLTAAAAEVGEKSNHLTTRVLLGNASLLAVISRGRRPIHWQRLPLVAGDEATGIVSAVRSLEAAAPACGLDHLPETVVLHGRRELHSLIDQPWLMENLSQGYRWVEDPGLRPWDVARSLADQWLSHADEGLDLVRQHRDPVRLGRVVPYKEIAAYAMVAIMILGVLWLRLGDARNEQTALISTAPPMVADNQDPKAERDLLNSRATSISKFLDKRVRWSTVLGDVITTLPAGTRLTDIRGSSPMLVKKSKKVRSVPTTLILHGESVLDEQGRVPADLDDLARSIGQLESVAEHFRSVEMSDVRRVVSQKTGVTGAEFSLVFTNPTGK